jgi:hypothetical protein
MHVWRFEVLFEREGGRGLWTMMCVWLSILISRRQGGSLKFVSFSISTPSALVKLFLLLQNINIPIPSKLQEQISKISISRLWHGAAICTGLSQGQDVRRDTKVTANGSNKEKDEFVSVERREGGKEEYD